MYLYTIICHNSKNNYHLKNKNIINFKCKNMRGQKIIEFKIED